MRAPDSGSRAIPCPPPTTQDQSSITLTWCPRRPSSARVASAMRDSASSSRSRYTRIRGASMASCRFRPNSRKLSSICGCVWRMPYEPGVPMESAKAPSRKTWVGDIMVPDLRPGFSTLGDPGSRSDHLRMLLSTSPVPGTAKPEPKAIPSVWVTETTVPSASAHAKWVVCSLTNCAGWPSAIWPASRSRRVDARPLRRRVRLGHQARDRRRARIGEGQPVRRAELDGLDQVMEVVGGVVAPARQVEALQDVEGLEHLERGERRRHRADLAPAIRDGEGLAPLRLERGQVLLR